MHLKTSGNFIELQLHSIQFHRIRIHRTTLQNISHLFLTKKEDQHVFIALKNMFLLHFLLHEKGRPTCFNIALPRQIFQIDRNENVALLGRSRSYHIINCAIHTETFFRNLIESTRNQIVFTIFWLIWIQADVRLVPNQSENGKYNLISG